jgi:hypothetical protein
MRKLRGRCLFYRLKPERNMLSLAPSVRATFVCSLHGLGSKMKQHCDTVFRTTAIRAERTVADDFSFTPAGAR